MSPPSVTLLSQALSKIRLHWQTPEPPPNESLSGFGVRQKICNPKVFLRECAQRRALVNMVLPNIGTSLSILAERLLASQGGLCSI